MNIIRSLNKNTNTGFPEKATWIIAIVFLSIISLETFSLPPNKFTFNTSNNNTLADNFFWSPDNKSAKTNINNNVSNSNTLAAVSSAACPSYTCPGTSGCTYIINTTNSANYNVYVGEKICLEAGAIYTGNIGLYGGTIQNCATAAQSFSYFIDGSSPPSTFDNYGIYDLTTNPAVQDELVVNNYGTFSVYSLTISIDAVFNNYCTVDLDNNLFIAATGTLNNYDQITSSNNFTLDLNSNVNLNGGSITANQFFNDGTIEGITCGTITISTNTNNTSSGSLLGEIGFVDLTPPGSAPFIDTNNGTIGTNVTWTSCSSGPVEEICNNSIDDNSDGRIDEPFPGAVQTDMQLWLKADAGTNTTTNGSYVTSWSDQSINAYSANADVNSTDDPIFSDNALNFNPAIEFDGTYTDDFSDGLHLGSDYIYSTNEGVHVFMVLNPIAGGGQYDRVYDFGGTTTGYGFTWFTGATRLTTPTGYGGATKYWGHATGLEPSLLEFEIDFGDSESLYKDGSLLTTEPITLAQLTSLEIAESDHYGTATNGDHTSGPVSIGRKSGSRYLDQNRVFDGSIAEVIVYNDSLTQAETERINSYLAIKYGILLSHDYYSSSATNIKSIGDGYGHNVFGIGRDDCSGLNQKQSKSVEADAIITIGLASIEANNLANTATFAGDEHFLILGNNNAALNTTWNTANISTPGSNYGRINRAWHIEETADVGTTVFQIDVDDPDFDLPAMPATSDGNYYLFFDTDGDDDFTTGNPTVVPLTNSSGSIWETSIADPQDGPFTIGVSGPVTDEICNNGIDDNLDGRIDEPYPGDVPADIQLWLKADVGTNTTTNGTDVTSWADQSANGYTANSDVNSTDDPTYTENAINFNPGVNFDGNYTDDFSDGLHLGSDYIYSENAAIQIFAVVNPYADAESENFVFDFGSAPAQGYGIEYSDTNFGIYSNGTNTQNTHTTGAIPTLIEGKIDFGNQQSFHCNVQTKGSSVITLTELNAANINEDSAYSGTSDGPVSIGRKSAGVGLSTSGGQIFNGDIAEIIVYNEELANTDRRKVNTYLGLKYGLTISQNYYNSNSTVVKSIGDGYGNDIAGLGRDDCSGLDQRQSKSVETDAIITIGSGDIMATNSQNPSPVGIDNTFLIWGNDGAALNTNWNSTNVDISGQNLSRIDRVWRLSETSDVSVVVLQVEVDDPDFDLPPLPASSDGLYYLLQDDDGDFTNGGTTSTAMTLDSGDAWQAVIADIGSGYFSIGITDICAAQAPLLTK